MATGAQTVEALRAESERVADQLAQASSATRSAAVEYTDDVVARVGASGEQAVAAIRYHGESIAEPPAAPDFVN